MSPGEHRRQCYHSHWLTLTLSPSPAPSSSPTCHSQLPSRASSSCQHKINRASLGQLEYSSSLSLDSDSCGACPAPSPSHPPVASHSIHPPLGISSYFPPPCLACIQPPSPRGFHSPLHLSPSCSYCWNWIFQLYFWIPSTALFLTRQFASSTCLASPWPLRSISEILQWQVWCCSLCNYALFSPF